MDPVFQFQVDGKKREGQREREREGLVNRKKDNRESEN